MLVIITPNTDTFTNPTMVSLLGYLREKRQEVTLFGPQQELECPEEFGFLRLEETCFKLSFRNPKFWRAQIRSYWKVRGAIGNGEGSVLLAVDPLGLVIAGRIKKYLCPKAKLSYLSYEIFFTDELNGHYLKLKQKEIYYSKYIDALLSQDATRRDLLFAENHFSLQDDKVALVPVSSSPIDGVSPVDVRETMGINKLKKLVVYSGSVGNWCGTACIIEALESGIWPKDWHLVFHCRKASETGNALFSKLVELDANPEVAFSLHTEPFGPMSELASFLRGFDAALALYFPNRENPYYGKNMEEIGLSSGKFAMYMMLGLPTLVTSCKIYDALLKQYDFGASVSDAKSLCQALEKPDFKPAEARRLYEEVLQPKVSEFEKLIC